MLLLGVDPGMRNCGVALLRCPPGSQHPGDMDVMSMTSVWTDTRPAEGGWGSRRSDSHADRTRIVAREIRDLVGPRRPVLVMYEQFNSPNAKTMLQMGHILGAVAALAGIWEAPLISRLPTEIKLAAAGRRNGVSKAQVIAGVAALMGDANAANMSEMMTGIPKGRHDHAYDAVAAVMSAWDHQLFRAARSAHDSARRVPR